MNSTHTNVTVSELLSLVRTYKLASLPYEVNLAERTRQHESFQVVKVCWHFDYVSHEAYGLTMNLITFIFNKENKYFTFA